MSYVFVFLHENRGVHSFSWKATDLYSLAPPRLNTPEPAIQGPTRYSRNFQASWS